MLPVRSTYRAEGGDDRASPRAKAVGPMQAARAKVLVRGRWGFTRVGMLRGGTASLLLLLLVLPPPSNRRSSSTDIHMDRAGTCGGGGGGRGRRRRGGWRGIGVGN